jgi:probable rRNA maturation factor
MPKSSTKVKFNFLTPPYFLPKRRLLKLFVERLFKKEGKELMHLDYIFCSDKYLLKINKQYLHHDFFTDIITFNLSDTSTIMGEVYISIDRVRENAKIYKTSIVLETHRVIFHGALHLCGYEDRTKAQRLTMSNKEDYFLREYIERCFT